MGNYAIQSATGPNTGQIRGGERGQKPSDALTGTLQKRIVESGNVTMDLDLNGLNPEGFRGSQVARPITLQFTVAANSFFPILVFNDLLRTRAGIDGLNPRRGRRQP